MLRVLGQRNFAIYLTGSAFSLHGLWIQRVAIGWLAWELTGSPLWLGIIGILCCFICSIVAIVKANEAKAAIAQDPRYGGEGMATAGKVLGIIGIILFVLGIIANVLAGSAGPGPMDY